MLLKMVPQLKIDDYVKYRGEKHHNNLGTVIALFFSLSAFVSLLPYTFCLVVLILGPAHNLWRVNSTDALRLVFVAESVRWGETFVDRGLKN